MIVLLNGNSAFANKTTKDTELCTFAPKNDLKIGIGSRSSRGPGLDEQTYNAMIDKVENYYKPIVADRGAVLKINRMWSDDTVNSTAHRSGNNWFVDAYGGLARYPIMTPDAELAVLCHEMGHHLGGFPKFKGFFSSSWAAVEGQADYFATSKCFRRVNAEDDNISIMSNAQIPQEVVEGCVGTFKSQKEIALCQRESMAGQVLAQILFEIGKEDTKPSFSTPSTEVVSKTFEQHPVSQCRLDTYFNGSICGMAATEDFGQTEGSTGACAQEKGDTIGYRPTCWYKPAL